jgi:Mrp family chromosome partitioning ATPase
MLDDKSNSISKIIAVGSGKGGVGKSVISSLLAIKLRNEGFKVGILDADITGPSIQNMFGLKNK